LLDKKTHIIQLLDESFNGKLVYYPKTAIAELVKMAKTERDDLIAQIERGGIDIPRYRVITYEEIDNLVLPLLNHLSDISDILRAKEPKITKRKHNRKLKSTLSFGS
jgi:hypothetical protein